MNRSDAIFRLRSMLGGDAEPALSNQQIDELLNIAKVPDPTGLNPGETGYVLTVDLNWAAAEGWRWKAAMAAERYSFTTDGQTFTRAQMFTSCMTMHNSYRSRSATTVTVVDA